MKHSREGDGNRLKETIGIFYGAKNNRSMKCLRMDH